MFLATSSGSEQGFGRRCDHDLTAPFPVQQLISIETFAADATKPRVDKGSAELALRDGITEQSRVAVFHLDQQRSG